MLPDEPVLTIRGYVKAYLVETRSIAGLSGSPVYLNLPETSIGPEGKLQVRGGAGVIFIGMMLGYHVVASAEDQISVPRYAAANGDSANAQGGPSLDERNT